MLEADVAAGTGDFGSAGVTLNVGGEGISGGPVSAGGIADALAAAGNARTVAGARGCSIA